MNGMMIDEYSPPWFLLNGHMDSMYLYLLRKVYVEFNRERIELPDGDFLDLDWREDHATDHLLVLCHGLEGSSQSKYMLGMTQYAINHSWNVVNINFRSCSGEMNRLLPSYHHGQIDDLTYILNRILKSKSYQHIHMMGFSLGGNVIIKYLGTVGIGLDDRIKSAVAISVPSDLHSSAAALDEKSNFLYTMNFRKSLKKKFIEKDRQFPGVLDLSKYDQVKTWWEFDTTFTSKIFGFKDADEYYEQGSANNFIAGVRRPTLIINALNDPFLQRPSYPYQLIEKSSFVELLTPKRGGHVGFALKGKNYTWAEEKGFNFLLQHSN